MVILLYGQIHEDQIASRLRLSTELQRWKMFLYDAEKQV